MKDFDDGRDIGFEVGEMFVMRGIKQDSGAAFRDHVENPESKSDEFKDGFMEGYADSGADLYEVEPDDIK